MPKIRKHHKNDENDETSWKLWKIPQNVDYLQDVVSSLKGIYSGIDNTKIYDVDALKAVLIKDRSKYLCDKLESIFKNGLVENVFF